MTVTGDSRVTYELDYGFTDDEEDIETQHFGSLIGLRAWVRTELSEGVPYTVTKVTRRSLKGGVKW